MAHPFPTALRSGFRRVLTASVTLLAGFLVTTCAESPSAPSRPGFGAVRVAPVFDQFAQFAPLTLNQVRVIAVRAPVDTVLDESRSFSLTSQQLRLELPVVLQDTRETLAVTLQLLSGTTLLFEGTQDVEVVRGAAGGAVSIPVVYAGPGANAISLALAPVDTVVQLGATVQMRATALDGVGVDVGQFYLNWSLVGAGGNGRIDAGGLLTASATTDIFFVRGITPGGLRDSVQVRVVPAPNALTRSAGDNQSGVPGGRLGAALAVLVTGAGSVPIPGVTVSFTVTTGGGAVDNATVVTDANGIAQTGVVLGPTAGVQTFTATATGLAPVVFSATAVGLAIAPAPHTLTGGLEHSCELRNGAAFCWGGNGGDQLGEGSGFNAAVAMAVQGGLTFTSLTAGNTHTCGLTAAGQAFCWGDNSDAQLGDGTTTNRLAPTAVSGGLTFVQLEAGEYHTCGLTAAGTAYCWGGNFAGEIGDGTTTGRTVPTAVSTTQLFARISGGDTFTCALTPAGAAFCWGRNADGQLGDGTTVDRSTPVAVGGGRVFKDIGAGFRNSCALDTAGAGFCWGLFFGQGLTAPTAVGGGPFTSFSTGGNQVCALTAAGAAFCGGSNSDGQLGDGTINDSPTPVAVAGGLVFTEVSGGGLHSCGRTASGTFCWGRGNAGQMGDGGFTQRRTPVQVRGPATTIAVNAGNNQTATPGTAVAIPPSVIVRDAQGNGLPGLRVVFAVASGGGSVFPGTVATDASGIAAVLNWTLGTTPGANTLAVTITSPGVAGAPVSFTATGGTGPVTRTWTGEIDGDWSKPTNWTGCAVPGVNDSAVIVTGTNVPQLSAATSVGAVTILSGQLRVNGQSLTIARNLTTAGTGSLVMTGAADLVTVGADAAFGGGDETGQLTNGVLTVAGNLSQTAGTSAASFNATGNHTTQFPAGNHILAFASPGATTASGFQQLGWASGGTMELSTAVFVRGTASITGTGGATFNSGVSPRLTVGLLSTTTALTFNNVPLTIAQTTAGAITTQALTFQNMPTTVAQLVIQHPGAAAPLSLTGLVFSTVPVAPNGFYLDVTDNLADANALVINMLGATPASGGSFVKVTGATVNWPVGGGTSTWTGTVSTDWNTAGNWSGNQIPATDAAVVIGTAPNQPRLAGNTIIASLTINTGGNLNPFGFTLVVTGDLTTTGTGVLTMTSEDAVSVLGNAVFGGGDETGLLTDGILQVAGNFTQLATTSASSYRATANFVTAFSGASPTITLATPGVGTQSGFQDLVWVGTGTLTLGSDVPAAGNVTLSSSGANTVGSTNGRRLTVGSLINVARITFDNVPLTINQTGGAAFLADSITFQNMPTNVAQLEIQHPGIPGSFTLSNLIFSTVPVAPNGFYLDVTDNAPTDQTPLTIDILGATPATGDPFVRTSGGAIVNWGASATATWTGAVSTDWNTSGNWVGNAVPASGDNVLIPDGVTTYPVFTGSLTLRDLILESESSTALLTVNGGGLTVTGNLIVAGAIQGTGTMTIAGAGTHAVSGSIMALDVTANASVSGTLTVARALAVSGSANLDISEDQVDVGTAFSTSGTATLTMNSNSFLTVHGSATFGGGSTTNLLTGGYIGVEGDFLQSGDPASFAPSNGTSVSLNGTQSQSVTLSSSGSAFDILTFSNTSAPTIVSGPITVTREFDAGASGVEVTGGGTITTGGVNLTGMTFDNVRLVFTATGPAAPAALDNLTFQGYAGTLPQLEINHPGRGTPLDFTGLVFSGTPATFHLLANDNAADANFLVINLITPTPNDGTGLFSVQNGAVVNWPRANLTRTWTGAVSTDWSVAGNWSEGAVPIATSTVTIGAATNQPTLSADATVQSVVISTAGARLTIGGHTLTVAGNLTTHTDGLLVMTNPADLVVVNGDAAFQGGDETGLLTAGELRLAGGFTQQVQTSPNSFLASGTHRTVMVNPGQLQTVTFCCTANTSRFMNLDISTSAGINIQFAGNGVFVADTFIVQPGTGPTPTLYMLGSPLQAKRFRINKLIVNRGTLILNEGGVIGNEQFDNVTFQNYLASQTQFSLVAPGGAGVPRTLTFNNLAFQPLTAGDVGKYLTVTAPTGTLIVNLPGATPVSNGPAFTTTAGVATVNWGGGTTVDTWTGATSTDWGTATNWSLGRIPIAADSIVIPNAVTNFPTLTGRATVAAMFEDGRLTINGGTLEVTRGSASNAGINRIIQLSTATDSLIIGGPLGTPTSALTGVIVAGGDITTPGNFTGARLILNGTGNQSVIGGAGNIPFGILIINKPSGTATLGPGSLFNGDSIDVVSGTLASATPISLTGGIATAAGTSLSLTSSLTVGTNLFISGSYSVQSTIFSLPAAPTTVIPVLPYQQVEIQGGPGGNGTAILAGRTVLTGSLDLSGSTRATLSLGGHTLVVAGGLTTSGTGGSMVSMTNPLDSLVVGGSASFGSATPGSPGNFTAGTLIIGVNLIQLAPFGGNFQATGTHMTVLTGTNPSVTFATPGLTAGLSRLAGLTWTGTGTLTLGSDVYATNGLTTTATGPVTLLGDLAASRLLQLPLITAAGPLVFDQTRLAVVQSGAGTATGLNNATFQNMATNVTQLSIQHPGITAGSVDLSGLTFSSAPVSGLYISATDNNTGDGVPLVVNLTGPAPATSGGFTTVAGGATINWPTPAGFTWTGTVSTAWETAGNWAGGVVPTATSAVTIPAGTPFAPNAGTVASSAQDVTVATGATLTLVNPFGLIVAGNVDAPGTIAGTGTLSMTGATATLSGTVPTLNITGAVTIAGPTTTGGSNTTVTGAAAELFLGGNTFETTGLLFSNGARLSMTNGSDSLVVNTNAQFSGGSTLGRLTAGVIDIKGSFSQTSANSTTSFASTGTRVRSTGTTTVTYQFASPGAALSRFDQLFVNKTGILNLGSTLPVTILWVDAGSLVVNGRTITTAAGLIVENTGLLVMTNANDSVLVGGNAFFTGTADETGQMTAGILRVAANLSVSETTAFAPSGTHKTVLSNSGTSNISWTGAGAVPIVFQDLVVNTTTAGTPAIFNWARVNGTMTANGNGGINAATLNVRGPLVTSAGVGLGLDSLYLGAATPITGSGFVNARTFVLDGSVAQTVPTIPAPSGPDSASLVIRSDATMLNTGVVLNGLRIDGSSGRLNLNGNAVSVFGPFATADNGTLVMQNAADNLLVTGSAQWDGGTEVGLLTAGQLTVGGNFGQAASQFHATGTHRTTLTGTNATITSGFAQPFFNDLTVSGSVILATNTRLERDLVLTATGSIVSQGIEQLLGVRNVTTTAGSSLTPSLLEVLGTISAGGLVSPTNLTLSNPLGDVVPTPSATLAIQGLTISSTAGTYTLGGDITIPGQMAVAGPLVIGAHELQAASLLVNTASGVLYMQDPTSKVTVGGSATFRGGNSQEAMTEGVLRVVGSFLQQATNDSASFAPSANHLTILGGALGAQVTFESPSQSKFNNLDIASATSNLTMASDLPIKGSLTASGGHTLFASGFSVLARRLQVNGLVIDNGTVIVDEQNVPQAQQFDNVTFQGLTAPGSAGLLTLAAVGDNVTPRTVTFTGVNFPVVDPGSTYVGLVSSNSESVTVAMQGSNRVAVGAASSNPPNGTTVSGATVLWQ